MPQNTFITIKRGMEYQSHEESIYSKDAFFSPAYHQAKACLQEIVYANHSFYERQRHGQSECRPGVKADHTDAGVSRQLLGYPNNILAFCAERGQGKTSAMVSFANALQGIRLGENRWGYEAMEQEEKALFWNDSCVPKCQFVVVDSIDPTVMEDQDSIMEAILSRMFNQFQTEWERRADAPSFDRHEAESAQKDRMKLLELFQKCSRNLQVIGGVSAGQDADLLEQMMEQGDSSNMRGAIYRLICSFLSFMCGDNQNAYLVIQIDDADFNIPRAYNIIDDIRRYLVLPKVLILLAVNIFQLEATVEQHFIEQYKCSIQNNGMATVAHCHEIAERYVSKVIPGNHRIYLPDLQSIIGNETQHLQIKYLNEANHNILEETLPGTNRLLHYQDQLLRFLHQRTGLIFLNPGSFLHNLAPGNLRELTQFLTFFNQMDKLDIDYFTLVDYFSGHRPFESEKIELWRQNLAKTERYLIEIWAPVNLRAEGYAMLRGLSNEPDDNKNRHLLQILPNYYSRERVKFHETNGSSALTETEYRDNFIKICRNHGLSIYDSQKMNQQPGSECTYASYADVCEALNVLSALPGNNQQYKLIYAIHFLYTIRLHHLLLNQIEWSVKYHEGEQEKGDERENILVNFLADVLYKRKDMKGRPCGFPLWQYDFSAEYLRSSYGSKVPANDFSLITTFCRYTEPVNHSYVSRLITRDIWEDKTKHLCFNFFYSNLWDLDMLTSSKSEHSRFTPRSESGRRMRSKMVGSFVLLMNWDVQYALLRNLRYHELTSADILENMQGVYLGTYMTELLKQIRQLVDNDDYNHLFSQYPDYIKQREFGYIIQHSIFDFKKNMVSRIGEELAKIKRILDIHVDSFEKTIDDIFEKAQLTKSMRDLKTMTIPLFRAHNMTIPFSNDAEEDIYDLTLGEISSALEEYKKVLEREIKSGLEHK